MTAVLTGVEAAIEQIDVTACTIPTDFPEADGFSCREQIAQTTDRQALHLAQVIHMALHPEEVSG